MKEKALLCGCIVGEFGWEVLRFAPYVLGIYKNKYKQKVKLIICTREDRFDLYGQNADILVPLKIEGDGKEYKADCFRLMNYPVEEYYNLNKKLYNKYSKQFDIVEHIYPDIKGKSFANKNQYDCNQMIYDFKPRIENKILLDNYINNDKQSIIIAPRFRDGIRRNWNGWIELYDLIYNSNFFSKFNFIICGKEGEYILDPKDRIYDINKIEQNTNTSLVGITIETIKKAILTIGSQSGIPNLSLLLKTPVLEWGHQKHLHTVIYNPKRTKITFLNDDKYTLPAVEIFNEMIKLLHI